MCCDLYRHYEDCGCQLYAFLLECPLGPLHARCAREAGLIDKGDRKCPYHRRKYKLWRQKHPFVNKPPSLCLWSDRWPKPMTLDDVPEHIRWGWAKPSSSRGSSETKSSNAFHKGLPENHELDWAGYRQYVERACSFDGYYSDDTAEREIGPIEPPKGHYDGAFWTRKTSKMDLEG